MEEGVIRMQESRANAGKQDQTQEAADQAGPAEHGGFPQDGETTCWALFSTELSLTFLWKAVSTFLRQEMIQ